MPETEGSCKTERRAAVQDDICCSQFGPAVRHPVRFKFWKLTVAKFAYTYHTVIHIYIYDTTHASMDLPLWCIRCFCRPSQKISFSNVSGNRPSRHIGLLECQSSLQQTFKTSNKPKMLTKNNILGLLEVNCGKHFGAFWLFGASSKSPEYSFLRISYKCIT